MTCGSPFVYASPAWNGMCLYLVHAWMFLSCIYDQGVLENLHNMWKVCLHMHPLHGVACVCVLGGFGMVVSDVWTTHCYNRFGPRVCEWIYEIVSDAMLLLLLLLLLFLLLLFLLLFLLLLLLLLFVLGVFGCAFIHP